MQKVHELADERGARHDDADLPELTAEQAAEAGDLAADFFETMGWSPEPPAGPLAEALEEAPAAAPLRLRPPAPVNLVEVQFERCRPWIEAALAEGGLYTVEEVRGGLLAGACVLWPGEHCCIITERVPYDSGAVVLRVYAGGGETGEALAEIVSLAPGIMAAGRLMGCTEVQVEGRPGWARTLGKALGFELWHVVLRKAL